MRGRKPKPTFLKLVEGNPGHRALNLDEPSAPPAVPDPPDFLPPRALAEWQRLGPMLKDAGLISNLDRNQFAAYCMAFAVWCDAVEDLTKTGRYMRAPSGRIAISKAYELADNAEKRMLAIGVEFGLTPSARSRIKVGDDKPQDPFEAYLNNGPNAPPG